MDIAKFPLDKLIESALDFLTVHFSFITRTVSKATGAAIDAIVQVV